MKAPASSAAPPATAIVPARVDINLCANSMGPTSLSGEHCDAITEGVHVARSRAASAGVDQIDVLDEMPDDVALVGRGIVAGAVRLGLRSTGVLGPAGHVEHRESLDGHDVVTTAAETPERRQDHRDQPRIR